MAANKKPTMSRKPARKADDAAAEAFVSGAKYTKPGEGEAVTEYPWEAHERGEKKRMNFYWEAGFVAKMKWLAEHMAKSGNAWAGESLERLADDKIEKITGTKPTRTFHYDNDE